MDIDTAPIADRDGDAECEVEGCDGTYVLYDGDRVCRECGHISGTGGHDERTYRERHLPDKWRAFEHERSKPKYSGFRGPDRIKMVGGFARTYDFSTDFLAE